MMDFIRADLYRLMRSKGFWITEFLLFCAIISTTFFHANIHFGANISSNASATQSLGKLTGLQALDYFAGNTDSLLFFTIIGISMVLGVDLSRKLYKNCLSYGISKLSYYFSKFFVCVSIAAFHFLMILSISFVTASLSNGIGSAPSSFLPQLGAALFVQFLGTIAWIAIISFVLYASHSIVSSFLTYFLGGTLLTIPLVFYPDNEWLLYLTLRFNTDMAADSRAIVKAILTVVTVTLVFLISGLMVFKKKNL